MISIDAKNIEYAQHMLGKVPKEINLAAVNAINRTITKIKTQTSKSIRKNYLVSAKNVKGTLNIKRASRSKLCGVLASQGSRYRDYSLEYPVMVIQVQCSVKNAKHAILCVFLMVLAYRRCLALKMLLASLLHWQKLR